MAISAVMMFNSTGDVRKIYDAVIDEMGVRDNPPPGSVYHWCAPVRGGMQVCDVWETLEQFERFAKEQIGPVTAKHGLAPPLVDVRNIHELIVGRATSHKGCGLLVDFDGDTTQLLKQIDQANQRMDAVANPPQGLVFHCTTPTSTGIQVIDHWQAREDFERFLDTRLAQAMAAIGLPQPHVNEFDIYNTIDRRVAARV